MHRLPKPWPDLFAWDDIFRADDARLTTARWDLEEFDIQKAPGVSIPDAPEAKLRPLPPKPEQRYETKTVQVVTGHTPVDEIRLDASGYLAGTYGLPSINSRRGGEPIYQAQEVRVPIALSPNEQRAMDAYNSAAAHNANEMQRTRDHQQKNPSYSDSELERMGSEYWDNAGHMAADLLPMATRISDELRTVTALMHFVGTMVIPGQLQLIPAGHDLNDPLTGDDFSRAEKNMIKLYEEAGDNPPEWLRSEDYFEYGLYYTCGRFTPAHPDLSDWQLSLWLVHGSTGSRGSWDRDTDDFEAVTPRRLAQAVQDLFMGKDLAAPQREWPNWVQPDCAPRAFSQSRLSAHAQAQSHAMEFSHLNLPPM